MSNRARRVLVSWVIVAGSGLDREWFDDSLTRAAARPLSLTGPTEVAGIDAALAPS